MKKLRDLSIKKKYTAIVIMTMIIPVILLSITLHLASIENIESEIALDNIRKITSTENTIDLLKESMVDTAFISTPKFARYIEKNDTQSIDLSVFDIYNAIKLKGIQNIELGSAKHIVIVVDKEGHVISRSDIEWVGNRLSSKELGPGFYKALNGTLDYRTILFDRFFMIMGPQAILVRRGFKNFMGVAIQTPIHDTHGTQVGALIIITMINDNSELIDKIYSISNSKFTVYAPDGEVMTSYFQNPPEITPEIIELAKESIKEINAGTRNATGKDSIVYTIDRVYLKCKTQELKPYRFSFVVIPDIDGNFVSIRGFAIDLKEYDALILKQQTHTASILFVSSILLSLFGMFLTKRAISPILELTSAAKKLSEGDFNAKLPNAYGDEVGQLTNAFDCMRLNIKKEQEFVKNIIQFIPYPVYLIYLDKECKVKYANTEFAIWAGYEKIDNIIGHVIHDIFNLKANETISNIVIDTGKEIINHERKLINRKGAEEYHLVSCLPIEDINREIIGALEVIVDITDLKRLEFELTQKNKELESFGYTVSHDLKSPLLTIKGFSNMLESELKGKIEGSDAETYIKYIIDGADKMEVLLSEILQLSRAGLVIKSKEEVPFNTIIDEVIFQLQSEIRSRGVIINVAKNLPIVLVDRMRIIEVLINLIGNSIQYIGDANLNPMIEIGYKPDKNAFFVKDNGIGIDKTEHDKVFDLFYRVSEKIKGTGAGLAIVKKIIMAHGGKIWIDSEKGKGCTVYFTLPNASP